MSCHLTVGRGRTIASMQFRGIEVHQSLNGAAWIQCLGMAGSPYIYSELNSLTLSFLNWRIQHSLPSNCAVHLYWFPQSIFWYRIWRPEHSFVQNLVICMLNALRTLASLSKCDTWVSGSCWPSWRVTQQNLSIVILTLQLQLVCKSLNMQKRF